LHTSNKAKSRKWEDGENDADHGLGAKNAVMNEMARATTPGNCGSYNIESLMRERRAASTGSLLAPKKPGEDCGLVFLAHDVIHVHAFTRLSHSV
jgi:hypothetical protein